VRPYAFVAGIVLVVAFACQMGFDVTHAGKPGFFLWVGLPTLALAILGGVRAHRDGILREWFRPRFGDFSIAVGTAAALFAGAFAFSKMLGLPQILWFGRLYEQVGEAPEARKNVTWIVPALIVTACAEEVVWRGLVPSLLEEKIGSRRAWVWAAVLYAIAHVPTVWQLKDPNAGMNPLVIMAALGAGLVWGYMARRFERLLPGMISHVLFDWTVMMMFRLWGPSV